MHIFSRSLNWQDVYSNAINFVQEATQIQLGN